MVKIYINTLLPTEELTPENFTESFDVYAAKLEKLAKVFKKFSKYMQKNNIQVQDTDGFSSSGTFEVDEIDAGRLKKAGFVVDYEEIESEPEILAFYIDTDLDAVLEETAESLENLRGPKVTLEYPALPEGSNGETLTFNLADILDPDIELEGDLTPGHMTLQVFPQEDDTHKFNLIMLDFYSDPAEFNLDRERMVFCYKEKDDDEWKEKPVRDLEHLYPQADQGKVQDQEHDISDIHAHDHTPEEFRVPWNEQGTWLDAVKDEGPHQYRRDRIARNPEGEKGNEGGLRGTVIGRLRCGDPCNGPFAKHLRVL